MIAITLLQIANPVLLSAHLGFSADRGYSFRQLANVKELRTYGSLLLPRRLSYRLAGFSVLSSALLSNGFSQARFSVPDSVGHSDAAKHIKIFIWLLSKLSMRPKIVRSSPSRDPYPSGLVTKKTPLTVAGQPRIRTQGLHRVPF